jgi:hypothetical protein
LRTFKITALPHLYLLALTGAIHLVHASGADQVEALLTRWDPYYGLGNLDRTKRFSIRVPGNFSLFSTIITLPLLDPMLGYTRQTNSLN